MSRVQTLTLDDFPRPRIARTLSPNGRAHWTTRRAASMAVATRVSIAASVQGLVPMRGFVVMRPRFVYPNVRRRDDDNAATGVLKSARDILVRRGYLINDDLQHLRQMPVEVTVEKGVRRLVLEFEEAGGG